MKKLYQVIASLIFVFSATLIFFACGEMQTLSTPVSIGIVNNEIYNSATNEYERTEILLVTDKNKYANGYKFFITDSANYENIDNYIAITSSTNSLDITNYFNPRKVYHYFVQYLGGKKYKDSEYSVTKVYIPPQESVATPYIQLLNQELSWFRIINATGYEVYEKVLDINDEIVTNNTLISTLNSETFSLDLSNRLSSFNVPYYKYQYTVKALASGYYKSSDLSTNVTFIKEITLSIPQNLEVTKEENKYYLNWDAVDYANGYKVIINDNAGAPIKTTENKLEITQYLTNYTSFSFKVKASSSEAINYNESNFSNTLIYDYTTNLNKPENLQIVREGEYINITWDNVNLAETYTLVIVYNNEEIYKVSSLDVTNAMVEISAYFGQLTSDKNITVKVQANAISHYILESEFTELDFTILATSE